MPVARYETLARWINARGWVAGAEIGLFDGRTHLYLLDHCPGLARLIGVDVWDLVPEFSEGKIKSGEKCYCDFCNETRRARKAETVAQMRERMIRRLGSEKRSRLIVAPSVRASAFVPDATLDFIFVDGDHSTEGVAADIAFWRGKLASSGWMIGHDYNMASVRDAVHQHYRVEQVSVADDHVWYVPGWTRDEHNGAVMVGMINEHALAASIRPISKSTRERVIGLIGALQRIDREGIPGDVVECGVFLGANIIVARKIAPTRLCWLYDTFAGMTPPTAEDKTRTGRGAVRMYREKQELGVIWAGASVDDVVCSLQAAGVYDPGLLRFVVGDVAETLARPEQLPAMIALLRLDTDWYASTKIELEALYPRLARGGILIVDDYGHWQGARKAVDEYFGGDCPAMTYFDYSAVMMVKP